MAALALKGSHTSVANTKLPTLQGGPPYFSTALEAPAANEAQLVSSRAGKLTGTARRSTLTKKPHGLDS